MRRYRLGWAPAGWDTMASALRFPDEVLRGTGLGFVDDRGRRSDSFRARVLFPILDHQGTAIGLGGRQLPGGRPPKYKNTAETQLYRKAVQTVAEAQKASTSYLQRQLRVGYNNAARLIERMEKEGVVSVPDHVGRREVLIDPDGHAI